MALLSHYPHLSLPTLQGGDTVLVKAAGIPNITGSILNLAHGSKVGATANGAFTRTEGTDTGNAGAETGYNGPTNIFNFNASKSNSIYGNSNTVQPPALQLIPQIKF